MKVLAVSTTSTSTTSTASKTTLIIDTSVMNQHDLSISSSSYYAAPSSDSGCLGGLSSNNGGDVKLQAPQPQPSLHHQQETAVVAVSTAATLSVGGGVGDTTTGMEDWQLISDTQNFADMPGNMASLMDTIESSFTDG